MLKPISSFLGSSVYAKNTLIGKVEDFYFDDQSWAIRYMIVNTGGWLAGKQVLVSPLGIQSGDSDHRRIELNMSPEQVQHSPSINSEMPVSKQQEAEYYDYFHWPYYWHGAGIWGIAPSIEDALDRPFPIELRSKEIEQPHNHLRDLKEILKYHIRATDRQFGHVNDFMFDDRDWVIRYFVIKSSSWFSTNRTLISTKWIEGIRWEDRVFQVGLHSKKMKGAPQFRPDLPIDRSYENKLHEYYNQPIYWEDQEDRLKKVG